MKKPPFLLVLSILLSISVLASAAYAVTLECFDDGSVKIDGIKKKWPIQAKYGKGDWFEVPGEYIHNEKEKTYTFFSDEALFVSQKGAKYSLKAGKYKYSVKCPPFKFSCRIFNVSVDYCYTRNNTFFSKFMVYNFHFDKTNVLRFTQPFMLWYEVKTEEGRNLVHAPDRYSPGFEGMNISLRKLNAGSKFVFKWQTEEKIKKFYIRYMGCRQERYNLYKSAECTEAIACTIDKDCFGDEHCREGICEKLDCGECQYIENNACWNYACCLDEDCYWGKWCLNHSCVELNCSFDEKIDNHSCAKLECGFDEYVSEHQCLKLECLDDEQAANHACQKLICGFYQKPKEHQCVNFLAYYYNKLFKSKGNTFTNLDNATNLNKT